MHSLLINRNTYAHTKILDLKTRDRLLVYRNVGEEELRQKGIFPADWNIGVSRTRGKQSCMIRHPHRGSRSKSLRSAGS